MSTLFVHDLENRGVMKFSATCNRGWFLYGHPGVSGGGRTTIELPDDVVIDKRLQIGRMVYVPHPKLPNYAAVVGTPWNAVLPSTLTLYNAEYLFQMRTPERSVKYVAPIPSIVGEMLNQMNDQERLFISLGTVTGGNVVHEETLDRRTFWEQLVPMLERTGYEMVIRPERGNGKQLQLYVDIGINLGEDTGFLLHDSRQGKNMRVMSAQVDGEIVNRVIGMSGQSTAETVLETDVLLDDDSRQLYRARSRTVQFRDVTQISTLTDYAQNYLNTAKQPYIDLNIEVSDVGDAFTNLRPGNRLQLHSTNVYLPGGVRGWSGIVRALAMAYDEEKNVVLMKVRGTL